VVRLDELTMNVAPGTAEAVQSARTRIQNGFTIFEGPIYDNQGVLRVAEGVVLTDAEKLALDWLMSNVRGQME
ncbi:MAG: BMP family ABC transporter substrate-binding protein, partial [Clostridiales bacterium]|nr:BMP family ABC transporter substrate-binding protein [Clostridiales bacterium]